MLLRAIVERLAGKPRGRGPALVAIVVVAVANIAYVATTRRATTTMATRDDGDGASEDEATRAMRRVKNRRARAMTARARGDDG